MSSLRGSRILTSAERRLLTPAEQFWKLSRRRPIPRPFIIGVNERRQREYNKFRERNRLNIERNEKRKNRLANKPFGNLRREMFRVGDTRNEYENLQYPLSEWEMLQPALLVDEEFHRNGPFGYQHENEVNLERDLRKMVLKMLNNMWTLDLNKAFQNAPSYVINRTRRELWYVIHEDLREWLHFEFVYPNRFPNDCPFCLLNLQTCFFSCVFFVEIADF